jgi:hypothetical protein
MDTFADIDNVIRTNLQTFKKPGALTVRPGYKIAAGWITKTPAIVVTVDRKRLAVAAADMIPSKIGIYPTDVREATQLQKLSHANASMYATVVATARPEFAQPHFPLERDAQTGGLLEIPAPAAAVQALAAKPKLKYTPPPGASLAAVTEKMSIRCHASPDAGWLTLKDFLTGINDQLTVGMYDFTSAHVLEAVKDGLATRQKLALVLDHPALNRSADQSGEETQAALAERLTIREQFAWAAEARDRKVRTGIFPSAYHIKVAVKDHQSFWLSSGNWNNSNQPDIDPFDPAADRAAIDAIAKKSDRDWHVIVEHIGLAQTLEAFLQHDLEVALPLQAEPAPDPVAAFAAALAPELPVFALMAPPNYFAPFDIVDEVVTVQPLLTPDSGVGNYASNILALIQSAMTRLYIQTQYIHPPRDGVDDSFRDLIGAVSAKINDGVDVRIILSEFEATGGWLEKLLAAGVDTAHVRIQNGVHNKGFIIDSKVVALGSQNWSGDGVLRNRDATLIVSNARVAQYFEKIFLQDWQTLASQQLRAEVSTTAVPIAAPN